MAIAQDNQSILVVDDDVIALDGLTELLQNHGYHVRRAQNGREALDAAKRPPPPAIILLDLLMPVMDGWEFMRQQRLEPSIAHIPVVVVSAAASAVPPQAKALISKPVNVNRLMSIVQKYYSQAP